eukprot:13678099-Alexandrium_andersonii.AAC.1
MRVLTAKQLGTAPSKTAGSPMVCPRPLFDNTEAQCATDPIPKPSGKRRMPVGRATCPECRC